MPTTFTKDPSAVLDYVFDWTAWLAGDTITAHTVTVGTGISKTLDQHSDTAVTVWLAGGTLGASYDVNCQITTAQGRTDQRTAKVRIQDR